MFITSPVLRCRLKTPCATGTRSSSVSLQCIHQQRTPFGHCRSQRRLVACGMGGVTPPSAATLRSRRRSNVTGKRPRDQWGTPQAQDLAAFLGASHLGERKWRRRTGEVKNRGRGSGIFLSCLKFRAALVRTAFFIQIARLYVVCFPRGCWLVALRFNDCLRALSLLLRFLASHDSSLPLLASRARPAHADVAPPRPS